MLDSLAEDCEEWFDAQTEHAEGPTSELFDEFGNHRKRRSANEQKLFYFEVVLFVEIICMILFRIA